MQDTAALAKTKTEQSESASRVKLDELQIYFFASLMD